MKPLKLSRVLFAAISLSIMGLLLRAVAHPWAEPALWQVYDQTFKKAKYVDLTHTITPSMPVWAGFGPSTFGPTVNPKTGEPYTYKDDGFEATHYNLSTDQLGTQLDLPAHWNPDYPAIDELPATFTPRPLVVISIVDKVAKDPGYHLNVADILAWEKEHGRIPEGSVVFVRSGWSKEWPNPELASRTVFPGVKLEALKFLHEQRHILLHGHEPLETPHPTWKAKLGCSRMAILRRKEWRIWIRFLRPGRWSP